jgi:hypothetical protein
MVRRLFADHDLAQRKSNSSDAMFAALPEGFGTSLVERSARKVP